MAALSLSLSLSLSISLEGKGVLKDTVRALFKLSLIIIPAYLSVVFPLSQTRFFPPLPLLRVSSNYFSLTLKNLMHSCHSFLHLVFSISVVSEWLAAFYCVAEHLFTALLTELFLTAGIKIAGVDRVVLYLCSVPVV